MDCHSHMIVKSFFLETISQLLVKRDILNHQFISVEAGGLQTLLSG